MLGKRLKLLRGSRTQEEIANHLGISRARYSHYENGRVEPDTDLLNKMSEFFDVSIDYLLGRVEDRKIKLSEVEREFYDNAEMDIEELLKYFQPKIDDRPATEDEIQQAIAFIRTLRKMRNQDS